MVSKRALLNFTSHGSPCPPRTFMITLRPVRFCLLTIVILILFTTCNTFQLENLSLISSFYPHVYISSEAIFLETFIYSLNPYLWPDLINSLFLFSTSSKYYAVSCLLTRVADPGSYYPDPDPTKNRTRKNTDDPKSTYEKKRNRIPVFLEPQIHQTFVRAYFMYQVQRGIQIYKNHLASPMSTIVS